MAAANAVMANGTLAHGLDYDDTLEEAIVHTGCCAGMTALAVGEEMDASGAAVLEAAIVGTEVLCKVGLVAPGKFHARGIPFHAGVLDNGQRPGQFGIEIVGGPGRFVGGLDLRERVADASEAFGHLLGVAARGEFRLLQKPDATGEVLDGFLPAGLKFDLASPNFLETRAFAFQALLEAFQLGQPLLLLGGPRLHFGRRRCAGDAASRCCLPGLAGCQKIAVHKLSRVEFRSHVGILVLPPKTVKQPVKVSAPSCSQPRVLPRRRA